MSRRPEKRLEYPGPQESLLLVEGADDYHAIGYLCEIHGIEGQTRYKEAGGYERMREALDVQLDESGLRRLGIIVDADAGVTSRWASLRDRLTDDECGFRPENVPPIHDSNGAILRQDGRPTVGVWIMPNNEDAGALEMFLRTLVPGDDPLWNYAGECVTNLPVLPATASDNWKNKAHLHTWLAWRGDTPGKPIGQAMNARDFDPFAPDAMAFMAWVRRLLAA